MDLSKGSAKRREWKYLNPSWWWLSWQKKHENVFNFIIISNGFAAQCIHLKTVFVRVRKSGLLIKQMFLGQHVGPVCQLVYQSAKFLSIQKTHLPCTSSSSGLFFGFLILQNKRHIQSYIMCVQNLWDDSSNWFLVLVRRWGPGGHAFEFV